MKPFDLELAKKGHPLCTRNGRDARIICFDRAHNNYPIVGLVRVPGNELVEIWTNGGRYQFEAGAQSPSDLFMKSKTEKRWMYISNEEMTRGRTFVNILYTSRPEKNEQDRDSAQLIEFEVEV